MEHHTTTSRNEAERLMGIAEKLLRAKDFSSCKDFAILAHETEPLLEGPDQILAVTEVLLAAEKGFNKQHDWYSVLKIPQRTQDLELIKKQYRLLVLLLHPDKNSFPFADSAFRFVADAWAVLSDPAKKAQFDTELSHFARVDLVGGLPQQQQQQFQQQKKPRKPRESHQKMPVRRPAKGSGGSGAKPTNQSGIGNSGKTKASPNFWTPCPYCYNLYEYSRAFEGCCMKCDNVNCRKTFTAAEISSMPPMVPGQEAYYCCWGFFPMGFVQKNVDRFQSWTQQTFEDTGATAVNLEEADVPSPPPPPPAAQNESTPVEVVPVSNPVHGNRKRGRPRKS